MMDMGGAIHALELGLIADAIPMNALKHAVTMSQILFGSDYPYRSSKENTMGLLAAKILGVTLDQFVSIRGFCC
jgi:predicted TIM-barrel fold metal-dependent hydrolase